MSSDSEKVAIVIIAVVFFGAICCFISDDEYKGECVYLNYTANITDHYEEDYVLYTVMPVGKGVVTIPQYYHDYYIKADNQKFSVSHSLYTKITANNTVQLTKNLNNSVTEINYDYYENI